MSEITHRPLTPSGNMSPEANIQIEGMINNTITRADAISHLLYTPNNPPVMYQRRPQPEINFDQFCYHLHTIDTSAHARKNRYEKTWQVLQDLGHEGLFGGQNAGMLQTDVLQTTVDGWFCANNNSGPKKPDSPYASFAISLADHFSTRKTEQRVELDRYPVSFRGLDRTKSVKLVGAYSLKQLAGKKIDSSVPSKMLSTVVSAFMHPASIPYSSKAGYLRAKNGIVFTGPTISSDIYVPGIEPNHFAVGVDALIAQKRPMPDSISYFLRLCLRALEAQGIVKAAA